MCVPYQLELELFGQLECGVVDRTVWKLNQECRSLDHTPISSDEETESQSPALATCDGRICR